MHVDYNKSIGQLYEEANKKGIKLKPVKEHQLDSLMEKCHTAIREIHRPIYKTKSATNAKIISVVDSRNVLLGPILSRETYDYMSEGFTEEAPERIVGRVSSYNSNTYKGRIYVSKEGRPVAFELAENIRFPKTVKTIVNSLSENAMKNYNEKGSLVYCNVLKNKSKAGHLKSYKILDVSDEPWREGF